MFKPHGFIAIVLMALIGLYGCGDNSRFQHSSSQSNQTNPALSSTNDEFQTPPQTPPLRGMSANKQPPVQYTPADIILKWELPTSRADGEALSVADIGGYEIAYSGVDGRRITIPIDDPLTSQYKIFNLPPNNYAFNISSYDTENRFSLPSVTAHLSREQFPRKNLE